MTTTREPSGSDTAAVDHRGLQVLSFEECLRRVASAPVGRLAFRDAGELLVLPVNHVSDGVAVAFRTTWGSKFAATVSEEPVAFEVDDYDAPSRTGWSVLVKGTATIVDDDDACRHLEHLLGSPWTGPPEDCFWVRIRPDEVTGREMVHSRSLSECC